MYHLHYEKEVVLFFNTCRQLVVLFFTASRELSCSSQSPDSCPALNHIQTGVLLFLTTSRQLSCFNHIQTGVVLFLTTSTPAPVPTRPAFGEFRPRRVLAVNLTTHLSSSLVFSPKAGYGRNQSPVRRPVWLWHTAF